MLFRSANNRNDGAGRLGEGDEVLLVRTEGSIKGADDLLAVIEAKKRSEEVGEST